MRLGCRALSNDPATSEPIGNICDVVGLTSGVTATGWGRRGDVWRRLETLEGAWRRWETLKTPRDAYVVSCHNYLPNGRITVGSGTRTVTADHDRPVRSGYRWVL